MCISITQVMPFMRPLSLINCVLVVSHVIQFAITRGQLTRKGKLKRSQSQCASPNKTHSYHKPSVNHCLIPITFLFKYSLLYLFLSQKIFFSNIIVIQSVATFPPTTPHLITARLTPVLKWLGFLFLASIGAAVNQFCAYCPLHPFFCNFFIHRLSLLSSLYCELLLLNRFKFTLISFVLWLCEFLFSNF